MRKMNTTAIVLASPAPQRATIFSALDPGARPACGEQLIPVPVDSEHDGWTCVRPAGHLPTHDHRAEDGTTW